MNHEADLGERESLETPPAEYAKAVGSRLRAVRFELHLSLQRVDALSEREFRTSVLGAYERGDRAISLPRLQRLAMLYEVPLQRLLPHDPASGQDAVSGRRLTKSGVRQSRERASSEMPARGTTIDLVKLNTIQGPEHDVLVPYLAAIQEMRRHFQGPTITIRSEDLRVIACLVGVAPEGMNLRLERLGVSQRQAEHESAHPRRAS